MTETQAAEMLTLLQSLHQVGYLCLFGAGGIWGAVVGASW